MSRKVLAETSVYKAEWDSRGFPVFTWKKFSAGDTFRDGARHWEEIMGERGVERYVVNTSGVTAHDDDDLQWLEETWIPDLIDMGIRYGAGVYADSVIAEMEMEKFEDRLSGIHPEYEFRVFGTEDEATEWLQQV